jgi:hypothetical protein
VGLSELLSELDWSEPLVDKPLDEHIATHMDAGDKLRERWKRPDALAMQACQRIMALRDESGLERCAYVLRSLKTPAEVETLQQVYGSRFILVGVYAPDDERHAFLTERIAKDRGKEHDGTLAEWNAATALPRLFDAPPSELRQNQPAYRVREQLLARVVEERENASGLKMRTSASMAGKKTATVHTTSSRRASPSTRAPESPRRSVR